VQTIVATCTTSGFGSITANHLLDDHEVVLAAHHRRTPHQRHPRLHDRAVDLADLTAVAAWAEDLVAALRGGDLPPLTAVVANAGVQVPSGPEISAQGLELTIAVNHLAHVLLVNRLVDLLPAGGRVIITSSGTHRGDALSRMFGIRPPRLEPVARMADPASVATTRPRGCGATPPPSWPTPCTSWPWPRSAPT
jgi:NAD(P)-dependent dehydrogenase (short-subunit alcohol dehydrogenase family)